MIGIIKKVSKIGATNTIRINELKPISKSGDSAFGTKNSSMKEKVKPMPKANRYTLNI